MRTSESNPKVSTSMHNSTPSALEINLASPAKNKNSRPHDSACFKGAICGDLKMKLPPLSSVHKSRFMVSSCEVLLASLKCRSGEESIDRRSVCW